MTKATTSNPLIDTSTSDTNAEIALHPLVLLTISDYITRRTLRQQSGPIVGAIIGQQDGRQLTLEVAFECKTMQTGGQVLLDKMWFENRLEQYRTVFKAPQLDLVGWFTIGSEAGPEPRHIPLHHQIQSQYSLENAILLLFHPEQVAQSSQSGGKLPLTLYEGVRASSEDAGANAMDIDGASGSALKFRELAYAVETGEAEMISLDFVARGGGNAAAVQTTQTKPQPAAAAESSKGKGKAKVVDGPAETAEGPKNYLSAEDEEYLTSVQAKINAIKMLQSRIDLLQSYLSNLPPSYLTDASLPVSTDPSNQPNHQVLRSISSLLARLPLLTPSDTEAFNREGRQIKSDVQLVQLLSTLTRTAHDAKELGSKFVASEAYRGRMTRGMMGGGGGGGAPESPFDSYKGAQQWDDPGGPRADSGMGFV